MALLLMVSVGVSLSLVGSFHYQTVKTRFYDEAQRSGEVLLGVLRAVLEQRPGLLVGDDLQSIVLHFATDVPAIRRVSVVNYHLNIVADSDPGRIGLPTDQHRLITLIRGEKNQNFRYTRDGQSYQRLSQAIIGPYDETRKSTIIAAVSVDLALTPLDQRVDREFAVTFWFLVIAIALAGVPLYLATRGWLLAPLEALTSAIARVSEGDLSARSNVRVRHEIGTLSLAFDDMTENLERQALELDEANRNLVRSERLAALGQLSAGVGHEIRNPLGVIKNAIYFLLQTEKNLTEKGTHYLQLIDKKVLDADQIIADLLDFARDTVANPEEIELDRVVEAALDSAPVPENINVRRDLRPSVIVQGDSKQIERALRNLIGNALDAMTDGGELKLRCYEKGAQAIAEVSDNGIGIGRDDLEKIWQPLFSLKANGIGLGLPLCERYAMQNKGHIEVDSEPGRGSTFRLILPLQPGAGDQRD